MMMSKNFSWERVDAQLVAMTEGSELRPAPETPFRLALIGDWSGRANRGLLASSAELAAWRPLLVDRDNLDQVMARLGVKLHLPAANDFSLSLTITFNKLDDFHPDGIFQRVELFQALRDTRARLSNPKTFAQAAEKVRQWAAVRVAGSAAAEIAEEEKGRAESAVEISGGNLLDQILEGKPAKAVPHPPQKLSPEISELVREAVKPYLVPGNETERDELIAAVDHAISKEMRAILHHRDFQALEAAWRAVDFLVSRLETGTDLKIYLLDVSRAELDADLNAEGGIDSTGIYQILVEQTVGTAGAAPWAAVAANYRFDLTTEDARLLEKISLIAGEAGAPFIAAADSRVVGSESLVATPNPDDWRQSSDPEADAAWRELKQLPSARFLGLALPRFLLRLPYGKETEPTEEFDFAEMPADSGPSHGSYLWANPSFAVAFLLAKGFSEVGWDFRPSDFPEIEGLPLHVYQGGDEAKIKPCAEVLLTLRAAEKIIDRGLMPLLSLKDTDTVRLGIFQSIASTPLPGPWGQESSS